jgi:hypothetical protein
MSWRALDLACVVAVSTACSHGSIAPDCKTSADYGIVTGPRAAIEAERVATVTLLPYSIPGKPPHTTHFVDVTLRNPASQPRWMLVAGSFGEPDLLSPVVGLTETLVRVYVLSTSPRLVVFEAVFGNFVAVKLPQHGVATLRRVPVSSDDITDRELGIIVARTLDVGGTKFEAMVRGSALSDSPADATMPEETASVSTWQPRDPSASCKNAQAGALGAPTMPTAPLNLEIDYVARARAKP